jgi:hypothetical protein
MERFYLSVGEAETLQARFAGLVEKSDRLPSTDSVQKVLQKESGSW